MPLSVRCKLWLYVEGGGQSEMLYNGGISVLRHSWGLSERGAVLGGGVLGVDCIDRKSVV